MPLHSGFTCPGLVEARVPSPSACSSEILLLGQRTPLVLLVFILAGASLALPMAAPLAAPLAAQEIQLIGELRPRHEQRSPDFPSAPAADVMMRTRLGVAMGLSESLALRVVVQDVIAFGGSGTESGWDPDPDLFVGFVEVSEFLGSGVAVRAGRQEISLGNERLVSRNNWGHRGQRFDAVRLLGGRGAVSADLFSARLAGGSGSRWLHGAHAAIPLQADESLHLYALHNREGEESGTTHYTGGGHARVEAGGVEWILEGYLQRGERQGVSVSAYQFASGAARTFDRVRTQLLYEHYSGDDGRGDRLGSFDRLRGSNHGFHGYADLFTSLPQNAGGRGLGDLNLSATMDLGFGTEFQLKVHRFRVVEPRDLSSGRFGEELDLVLTHRPRSGVTLEAGLSRVWAGPALEELRGLERNLTFGYAMVGLVF
ncbi:MAG: hypothetical protein EA421_11525 [Gemmatimonadales bacterium]|nr:MAG: hypothetical protein EA421_11525 [Gemmatimonadales bacterium]